MNIATGVVVIGVIATGYFVFFKKDATVSTTVTTSLVGAQETVIVGAQVSGTLRELEDLKRAVKDSAEVFRSAAFQSLTNFSVAVPEEPLGRDNPFELTAWKARQKALEETASKRGSSSQSSQSASVSGMQPAGDTTSGI